jgi:hypothetical protein
MCGDYDSVLGMSKDEPLPRTPHGPFSAQPARHPESLEARCQFRTARQVRRPGEIAAMKIGGNDGFGVESATSLNGKDFKKLSFFIIQRNEIVELEMARPLLSAFDTTDRIEDKSKAVAITSSWRIDPIRTIDIVVDYEIRRGEVHSDVQVIFRREGDKLLPLAGELPIELRQELDTRKMN